MKIDLRYVLAGALVGYLLSRFLVSRLNGSGTAAPAAGDGVPAPGTQAYYDYYTGGGVLL